MFHVINIVMCFGQKAVIMFGSNATEDICRVCNGDNSTCNVITSKFIYVFQAVGCDGVLESNATEDICRVCNGDNSTCNVITGKFQKILAKGCKYRHR